MISRNSFIKEWQSLDAFLNTFLQKAEQCLKVQKGNKYIIFLYNEEDPQVGFYKDLSFKYDSAKEKKEIVVSFYGENRKGEVGKKVISYNSSDICDIIPYFYSYSNPFIVEKTQQERGLKVLIKKTISLLFVFLGEDIEDLKINSYKDNISSKCFSQKDSENQFLLYVPLKKDIDIMSLDFQMKLQECQIFSEVILQEHYAGINLIQGNEVNNSFIGILIRKKNFKVEGESVEDKISILQKINKIVESKILKID